MTRRTTRSRLAHQRPGVRIFPHGQRSRLGILRNFVREIVSHDSFAQGIITFTLPMGSSRPLWPRDGWAQGGQAARRLSTVNTPQAESQPDKPPWLISKSIMGTDQRSEPVAFSRCITSPLEIRVSRSERVRGSLRSSSSLQRVLGDLITAASTLLGDIQEQADDAAQRQIRHVGMRGNESS